MAYAADAVGLAKGRDCSAEGKLERWKKLRVVCGLWVRATPGGRLSDHDRALCLSRQAEGSMGIRLL